MFSFQQIIIRRRRRGLGWSIIRGCILQTYQSIRIGYRENQQEKSGDSRGIFLITVSCSNVRNAIHELNCTQLKRENKELRSLKVCGYEGWNLPEPHLLRIRNSFVYDLTGMIKRHNLEERTLTNAFYMFSSRPERLRSNVIFCHIQSCKIL